MARILPNEVPRRIAKHVAKVCSAFKNIRDDAIECRLSYSLDGQPRPELLVIYRGAFAAIVAISDIVNEQLETLLHGSLFDNQTISEGLKLRECHRIEVYLTTVCASLGVDMIPLGIQKWIVFPFIPQNALDRLSAMLASEQYVLIGQENCHSDALYQQIQSISQNPLEQIILDSLKGNFNPEVSIPQQWIPRNRLVLRDNRATQTDFLLDYNQEQAVKRDLELSDEAENSLNSKGLRLVTGVAGCGKTLVLVFRARLAAKLNKDARILILTHNKPLCNEWNHRMRELDPTVSVEWHTFYQWIRLFMYYEPISATNRLQRIREVRASDPHAASFSIEFLNSEFAWISDHVGTLPNLDWYLAAQRFGRKKSLQKQQREVVFRLFMRYYERLSHEAKQDWEQIPGIFLEQLREQRIRLPVYDAIFIDEAQYFAPVWFECIKIATAHPRSQLFIVADPTQGFLRNGQSWQSVLGLEIRGRSQRLLQPYRNTRSILEFAKRFYLSRVSDDDEEVNLPEEWVLETIPEGDAPLLIQVGSPQDEKQRVLNELSELIKQGISPADILIIHCNARQVPIFEKWIERRHPGMVQQAKDQRDHKKLRITTLNSCGGLEARIVFLLESDELFDSEYGFHLDTLDRQERIFRNTRKLFVAITRATQKLVITYRKTSTNLKLSGQPQNICN